MRPVEEVVEELRAALLVRRSIPATVSIPSWYKETRSLNDKAIAGIMEVLRGRDMDAKKVRKAEGLLASHIRVGRILRRMGVEGESPLGVLEAMILDLVEEGLGGV